VRAPIPEEVLSSVTQHPLRRNYALTQGTPTYAPVAGREPEVTLDRSIDRKVRVSLRLRKEFPSSNLLASGHDEGDDADMETIGEIAGMDISSETEATENA